MPAPSTVHCPPFDDANRTLLALPNELLSMIFSMLPLEDLLCITRVCRLLRQVACGNGTLWREALPEVTVPMLSDLKAPIGWTGNLAIDLIVQDIEQNEVCTLSVFLRAHLSRLRSLQLWFRPLCEENPRDPASMALLLETLRADAPCLETLRLMGPDDNDPVFIDPQPLYSLGPDILGGALCSKLRSLILLGAFALDVPCAAFRYVEEVVMTLSSLAPGPPTATQLHGHNRPVHKLFPALKYLYIYDIPSPDDADDSRIVSLDRLPALDKVLLSLRLVWEWDPDLDDDQIVQDDRALAWLQQSMHHVRELQAGHAQCPSVSTAVLSAVSSAHGLHIVPCEDEDAMIEMALWTNAPRCMRAVAVPYTQVHDLLGTVPALGINCNTLNTLTISTDAFCIGLLKIMPSAWRNFSNLRTLCLIIDWSSVCHELSMGGGWFIKRQDLEDLPSIDSITNLRLRTSESEQRVSEGILIPNPIDAQCVLEFATRITPQATKVQVCSEIPLLHADLLHHHTTFMFSYAALISFGSSSFHLCPSLF